MSVAAVRGSLSACAAVVLGGCAHASFGGSMSGYDQQACIENALRHHPDASSIDSARRRFSESCRGGEASSCSALGVMNELGLGAPADVRTAASLFRRACDAGNARGCVNLGGLLARGEGVPRDAARAQHLFADACRQDEMSGCARLGRQVLTRSDHPTRDELEYGRRLLEHACIRKERSACLDLGDALTGLRRHHDALVAYTKACLDGDEVACHRMDGPRTSTSQEAAAGWRR